ncbi:FAD:protein FMN transferase [Candidatus Omnitrophota bacterium]
MKYKKILILGLVILTIAGCSQKRLHREKRFLLGTIVEVISPYPEAAEIAFSEIERIENIFSIKEKDSAISHLNKTGYLNTNFEVTSLIEKSGLFYSLSDGCFDITIAPLTKIWKEALLKNKLPSKKLVRKNMALVGFNKVHIDRVNNSIKFKLKGMVADLGAIAKGYAIDVAVKELKRKGITSAIVNAGGDMYCLGTKFGKPWKLGLRHPREKDEIIDTLLIKDSAVATSGDYEQYMEIDGKRYSHIINPKTGSPVENDILSVTVIAKDAVTADSVATSVFLLGKERGAKIFQNYEGVNEIIIITKSDVSDN